MLHSFCKNVLFKLINIYHLTKGFVR
uniref:Uncharacterized protein n=1 Tax=Anguilla anguilla TaxID=7936 RepID=A0A0E9ULX5_ANGAN